MPSIHKLSLFALCLASVVALLLGFGLSVGTAYSGLKYGGYVFTFVLLAAWAYCSIPVILRMAGKVGWGRGTVLSVGAIVALATAIFLSIEPEWRVMDDEAILQATALSMHQSQDVASAQKGYWINGEFEILEMRLDKRPFLYPFVVSVLHRLLGYDVANAFLVNFLCGLGTVFVGYLLFALWFGRRVACLALLPLCAAPVFVVTVRSGGFDAMNFLFLGLLGLSLLAYLRNPAPREEAFLLSTAVVLAYLRYESVVAVPLAIGVVLWAGVRRSHIAVTPVTVMSPFFLVPFVWLFRCSVARVGAWEVEAVEGEVFSPGYVLGNLRDALAFFFDPRWSQANDIVLSCLGVLGLFAWLLRRLRQPTERAAPSKLEGGGPWLLLFFAVLLIHQGYFWSSFLHVLAQRLSLPILWALSFGLAYLLWCCGCARPRRWWIALGFLILGVVTSALPSLYHHPVRNEANRLGRLQNWKVAWLANQDLEPERTLFIDENPLVWTMMRWSAVRITRLPDRMASLQFHWDAGTFEQIYYLQIARQRDGGEWVAGIPLDPHVMIDDEPVAEFLMAPGYACRVFEVVDVRHPSNRFEAFWKKRAEERGTAAGEAAFRAAWIRHLP
jgi:hypothetical protein